ncbi:helix-turn-helix domain-containing protein [Streptosporangium sp. NBC_01469]|uniref:helix-turn-helix domain-containing protein n=1 Tax=Streptosporangium sp. NBC_01469 TaxID=2903898 RepID=UPI002E2CD29B|nr:helix-turn-helix transcriptional regulator [Streptosporangium sp. NBC_01469]
MAQRAQRIARADVTGQSTSKTSAGWQEFGRALRTWREQRELSLRGLAERIRWDYSLIARWEQGKNRPSFEAITILDAELGAGGELVKQALRMAMADTDRLRRSTVEAVEAKASTRDEGGDMERRRLMRDAAAVAVGGAVAPVLATLTDAWQASEPRISGASVSQEMIDDWEDAADTHARRAYVDSPAVVLAGLAADFADMAPHLSQDQPEPVQRDLAHAAARHASLIAGKWFDLGNRREARRWWGKTRSLSERSGDTLLAAWLTGREAAYRRTDLNEDLSDVLLVAQRARRLAGDRPSAPLVIALSAEAQTLAMLRRYVEATTALRRAEDVFDQLPSSPVGLDPHWMYFDRSLIYTLADDARRATEAQDAAKEFYSSGHHGTATIALHNAALHTRTDPEQGTRQALRIVETLPIARRDARVRAAARIILEVTPEKAHALPVTQELRALTAAGDRSA